MSTVLLLTAAVASFWLTGIALVTVLLRERLRRGTVCRAEFHGLALLLGVGGLSWLLFLWSLAGAPLGRTGSMACGLIGAVGGGWTLRRARPLRRLQTAPPNSWERCASALTGAVWVNLLVQSLLTPQRLWDERAIFGIKGAVLQLDATVRSPSLLQPKFVQYHPQYPLLLPLAEAYVYGWLGGVDDRWGKLIPPLAALGLWLTFAGVLRQTIGRDVAALFLLLLASVPALTTWDYGFLTAQADAVVAAFHGAATCYLWLTLRLAQRDGGAASDHSPPLIAGCLATCALFTKDEGIAFALVDALALALLLIWCVPRGTSATGPSMPLLLTARPLGRYLLPIALLSAVWFAHRRSLPTTTEMTYFDRLTLDGLQQGVATLSWSIPHLLQRMFREAAVWGLMWWGVAIGAVLQPRRWLQPPQLLLMLDLAGGLAGLLTAGMLAPTPVAEHLGGSAHRFLLQITPTAVLLLAALWEPDQLALGSRTPRTPG